MGDRQGIGILIAVIILLAAGFINLYVHNRQLRKENNMLFKKCVVGSISEKFRNDP